MKDIRNKGPRAKGTRKTEDGRQNLQPATPSVALCGTSAASVVKKETNKSAAQCPGLPEKYKPAFPTPLFLRGRERPADTFLPYTANTVAGCSLSSGVRSGAAAITATSEKGSLRDTLEEQPPTVNNQSATRRAQKKGGPCMKEK